MIDTTFKVVKKYYSFKVLNYFFPYFNKLLKKKKTKIRQPIYNILKKGEDIIDSNILL